MGSSSLPGQPAVPCLQLLPRMPPAEVPSCLAVPQTLETLPSLPFPVSFPPLWPFLSSVSQALRSSSPSVCPRMTSAPLLGDDCDVSVSTATGMTRGPSGALCATGKLTVSPQLPKSWPRGWHPIHLSLHHPFALLVSAEFPSCPWPGPGPSSLSAASGLRPPLVPHMVDVVIVLKQRLLARLLSGPFDGPK